MERQVDPEDIRLMIAMEVQEEIQETEETEETVAREAEPATADAVAMRLALR